MSTITGPPYPYNGSLNGSVVDPRPNPALSYSHVSGSSALGSYYTKTQINNLLATKLSIDGSIAMSGTFQARSIIPTANNTYDLGSSSSRFNNVYVNNLYSNNEIITNIQEQVSSIFGINTSATANSNIGTVYSLNTGISTSISNISIVTNVITVSVSSTVGFSVGLTVTITGTSILELNNTTFAISSVSPGVSITGSYTYSNLNVATSGTATITVFNINAYDRTTGVFKNIVSQTLKPTSSTALPESNATASFGIVQLKNTSNQMVIGTSPNLATITSPAPSGAVTLTLPNITTTIVGRTTTDNLSNKTLVAPLLAANSTFDSASSGDATLFDTNCNGMYVGRLGCIYTNYCSNSTFPNKPMFQVTLSGTQTSSSTGAFIDVQFNTLYLDTNGDFNTGTYTFTAPYEGIYLIGSNLLMTPGANTNDMIIQFRCSDAIYDGFNFGRVQGVALLAGLQQNFGGSTIMYMGVGSTVKVVFLQGGTTTNTSISSTIALGTIFYGYFLG